MFRLLPTFYSSVQREKKNLLHDKASARVSIVIQQRWMTDKKIVPLDSPHAFSRIFCILGVIIAVNNCLLTTFAIICRLPSFVPILKWQQKIKRYFTPCLIIIAASHFFFSRELSKDLTTLEWLEFIKTTDQQNKLFIIISDLLHITSLISYLGGFVLFNNQPHEKMRTIKRT
mgnify:CR=1 FL=1